MAPFLSKVFFRPRKKQDKDQPDASKRRSDPSLLEGKFERVSPNQSPIVDRFTDELNGNGHGKGKDGKSEKDKGGKGLKEPFSLLRSKSTTPAESSTLSDSPTQNRDYHLSLNLSTPKGDTRTRPLGVVFEGPEGVLSDATIGGRWLSPQETLVLVRVCSQEIMARGLETLGIMHPHWHSASTETQRRIISFFIQSLATNGGSNTLSTGTPSPSSSFDSQIASTRPHDVAAVLRWAIRHFQLEGTSFGKEREWYQTFFDAEKNASYPPRAFSEKLVPLVPKPHLDLLNAVLAVVSSLASHAEVNGISGSKLSMLLGLCLLTSQRSESGDDWQTFYSRWERHGRILEHLFLSQIRDEAAVNPLPKRLTELVRHYPYSSLPSSDGLLARTRFSTLRYEALFVHVESELPYAGFKPTKSLVHLLQTALKAEVVTADGETKALWEKLREATTSEDGDIDVYKILSDDSIQLFSLVDTNNATSPTFKLDNTNGTRSSSLNEGQRPASTGGSSPPNRRQHNASEPGVSASQMGGDNQIGLDWTQFSTSGFLDSGVLGTPLAETLLDKDLEVTRPTSKALSGRKSPSRKSSQHKGSVVGKGRKSLDTLPPITIPTTPPNADPKDQTNEEDITIVSRAKPVSLVKLDEAFIDFWADAISDPIAETWPRFIICRLIHPPGLEVEVSGKGPKALEWLIVEQKFVKSTSSPEPPTASEIPTPTPETTRPTSPRPSMKSLGSSARKRFTFWSSSDKDKDQDDDKGKTKKKKGVSSSPKIGEMGEILKEEDEGPAKKVAGERKPEEKPILEEVKEEMKEEETKEKKVNEEEADEDGKAAALVGAGALATGIVAAGVATGLTSGVVDEDKKEAIAEKDIEPASEEVKVKDVDESKLEENASESTLNASVTPGEAGGVAPPGLTSEKEDSETRVISNDASATVPEDVAATKVLEATPTAVEEVSKPVDEAKASVPVEAAEPVVPTSDQAAEEVSPPVLAAPEAEPAKPVEVVEPVAASEPVQTTEGVTTPVDTPASKVAEPIVPSAAQEEKAPVDEDIKGSDTVAAEPVLVAEASAPEAEAEVVAPSVTDEADAVEEVTPPVETVPTEQTAENIDHETVEAAEAVSPPVEATKEQPEPIAPVETEMSEPVAAIEEVPPPVETVAAEETAKTEITEPTAAIGEVTAPMDTSVLENGISAPSEVKEVSDPTGEGEVTALDEGTEKKQTEEAVAEAEPIEEEKAPVEVVAEPPVEVVEEVSPPAVDESNEENQTEEAAAEAEHIEEATPVETVVEPPTEVVQEVSPHEVVEETIAETKEPVESKEPQSVPVHEVPQSNNVPVSEEKAEVAVESAREEVEDSKVPESITQEIVEESSPDVEEEKDVAIEALSPDAAPASKTPDETITDDVPPPHETDNVKPPASTTTAVIDTEDDADPDPLTEVESTPQPPLNTIEAKATEAGSGPIKEAEEVPEPSLDNREASHADEIVEPVKETQDAVASNGHAENGHAEASLAGADLVEEVEKGAEEESKLVEAELSQVPESADDDGAVPPAEAEPEPPASEPVEATPAQDDKVTTETDAVGVSSKEAEGLSEQEVVDETPEKKPEGVLVHTEPLQDNSSEALAENAISLPPVPVVEAEPVPPAEPTSIPDPPPSELVVDVAETEAAIPPVVDESLPPAPARVVLSGDTPGPELALSSSELAAQPDTAADPEVKEAEPAKKAESDEKPDHESETVEADAFTDTQEPVKDA
ncbi:hypothetical protein L218DRAFT_588200 [Marasmius fiardii PR-910]|nr:hypothetical protein L218DRAFT_588200 [Marasmius fiardii PR-910]